MFDMRNLGPNIRSDSSYAGVLIATVFAVTRNAIILVAAVFATVLAATLDAAVIPWPKVVPFYPAMK